MKKNIFLFLFFYCMATSLYAQQRLSLPDVDAIGYDVDGSWIDLYKKVGTDRYAQRRLQIDRKKIRISKASAAYQMVWDLYSCNDTLSRNDIEKARERFVDVDNLRPIALENYIGKTFDIKEGGKWKRNDEKSNYVLKFLRADLAFAQLLRYAKADRYSYSVTTTSSCVPDSVTTWRGVSQPLNPLVLEMKGGKTVLLFAYRTFDYLLLPTIKGDQFVKLSRECQPAELTAAGNKYDAAAPYDFMNIVLKDFLNVKKTDEGRCQLVNAFGENMLKQDYDSIICGNRFIIAHTKKGVDVYNLYLQKLDLGNVLVAYEMPNCMIGCINVLNEKGAFYYDEMGKKMKNPWKIQFEVCGTVPHWTYSLLKKRGQYQLKYYTSGPGVTCEEDKRYVLSDCQPTDSISFLDGKKEYRCNGNSWFLGDLDVRPKWIRIGRNGKFGILAYDYKQPNDVEPKNGTVNYGDWKRPLKTYPVRTLKGETILPMVYDSIMMHNDGYIYFYKGGKAGIYSYNDTPVYDELEQSTRYFYHIVKDGVSGWLDLKTNKEHYFSKSKE
ncbi:hypothetical protein [Prevotella nigrescens]|uniref:hypothetical protein n=1 Tax=Prevotella nigrescens TaxID=28133 RepID=UPI002880737F|nr:hypothetical protein [Prevotella nigrescens]